MLIKSSLAAGGPSYGTRPAGFYIRGRKPVAFTAPHGRMGDILFSGPAVFGFMALPSKRQLGKASRIGIWTRG